jgi:hypothetical protein
MIDKDYAELIAKLYVKTLRKEIQWQRTSIQTRFKVVFDNSSLAIEQTGEEVGPDYYKRYYEYSIMGSAGEVVEKFVIREDTDTEVYKQSEIIWELARKIALRIDEVLKSVTKELEKLGQIGKANILEELGKNKDDSDLPF